jgi:hypothetical protein
MLVKFLYSTCTLLSIVVRAALAMQSYRVIQTTFGLGLQYIQYVQMPVILVPIVFFPEIMLKFKI